MTASNTELIVDPVDCLLILQLQLEDLESLRSLHKGKGRATDIADDLVATDLYRAELERQEQLLWDAKLAASFASALETDAEILAQFMAEEEQALLDRRLALAEERGGSSDEGDMDDDDSSSEGNNSSSDEDEEHDDSVSSIKEQKRYVAHAGPSNAQIPAGVPQFLETICTSCHDDRFCQPLPCGHPYCHLCLKQLFLHATKDEERFPPRCCNHEIPVFQVRPFLSKAEHTRYEEAVEQFSSTDRTYCYVATCSAFIPTPKAQRSAAAASDKRTCIRCGTQTCRICKKRWHANRDCPEDKELLQTLRMAAKKGWQRCQRCYALVEKEYGCQHMSEFLSDLAMHLS